MKDIIGIGLLQSILIWKKEYQMKPIQRRLSDLKGIFYDTESLELMLKENLIYEFFDLGLGNQESAFGTSIVYPGKVGVSIL